MNLIELVAPWIARNAMKRHYQNSSEALAHQNRLFEEFIKIGRKTVFGKAHDFQEVKTLAGFQKRVAVQSYEDLLPYVNKAIEGEPDVLWTGQPLYWAKTSGTTAGTKFIPVTKPAIKDQIRMARTALLANVHERNSAALVSGKLIFLSGSPELALKNGIRTGRLSGIVNHHVPSYLRRNQLPSYTTNCIDDWETKLDRIVEETYHQNLTLISGIPPWIQMYFDRLHEKSGGKTIEEIFPSLKGIVHGGVNFEPYRSNLEQSLGAKIDFIETFPASEGFFAFQDSQTEEGLLLNTDGGIYYEFVPVDEMGSERPSRLPLEAVQTGINYALIITTNAGLWSYNLGDTVKFLSINPYRIKVTGRVKHFISAFGEHVIAEEVEKAIIQSCVEHDARVNEFTVAPLVKGQGDSKHQWFIAFKQPPHDLQAFAQSLDRNMTSQNIYYKDLIEGGILQPCEVISLPETAFQTYMKSIGKLGGQNKLPRLSNNRKIADALVRKTNPN